VSQGLVISGMAIRHIAGSDDVDNPAIGDYGHLPMGPADNMALWAPWVRASLYMTEVFRRLNWRRTSSTGFALSHGGKTLVDLSRPSADLFRLQLKHMRSYADQRGDRAGEILTQLGFPSDYFASVLGLNGDAHRHTFELIAITQVVTAHAAMIAKHHLPSLRPDRRGASVLPMIQTPAHSSFPSAHAAEAFAAATVLAGLVDKLDALPPGKKPYPIKDKLVKLLFKQAERIAVNRTVAGMHFPIDSWAGASLGEAVGQMILAKCQSGAVTPRTYAATDSDFLLADFLPAVTGGTGDPATHGLDRGTAFNVSSSPLFRWLWGKVLDEHKL
jgi:hypothetical protein